MSDPVRLLLTDRLAPAAEDYFLPADKLLAGNPKQTVWMHYADPTGRFSVGLWRSEPGAWRIRYTEDEYCELLAGVSVVTDAGGTATTLRAGDTFVIPRGFAGTWEVLETTTKRFVIHEPGA